MEKALFVPLKREYYEAFERGEKDTEYRRYGPRWNEKTCHVGRMALLSLGYGKRHRMSRVVSGFEKKMMDSKAWLDCYGAPGLAACIKFSPILH